MKPVSRDILDLRGLLLHSYYAGTPLDTVVDGAGARHPKAEHGIDNFIRLYLQPILERNAPINIIAVLEGQNANARRRALLPQYKARKQQDEENETVRIEHDKMYEYARKLLLALGCVLVKTAYAEADDTIGYLVKNLKGGVIVHTVDNDLLQLATPNNNVVFFIKGKVAGAYKGMPLRPHNPVRMYKALCGDSSDGYIGVRGFGEKAWQALVDAYGLDGVVELEQLVKKDNFIQLEQIAKENNDALLEKLVEKREELSVAYKVATIHPEWCESSYGGNIIRPRWEKRVPTMERLRDALVPIGLDYWIAEFERYVLKLRLMDSKAWATIDRAKLFKQMMASPFLPFDYETYDTVKHEAYQQAKKSGGYVDVLNQQITGCSFAFGDNFQYSFYMPIKHRDTYNCKREDLHDVFLGVADAEFCAHNSSFEQVVSVTNLDIKFEYMMDTMIMANYVDENKRHGLKNLSKETLNYNQTNYSDVVPSGGDMRDVSGDEVLQYGCDDSITCAHMGVLFRIIMECEQTWDFYVENEVYFERAMLKGFIAGIPMDYARLDELRREDQEVYDKTDAEMRALLVEHCSEINEDGFNRLWVEVELYESRVLAEKEKTPDEIASILNEKKHALRAACRYTPIQAPEVKADRKTVSKIAQKLNLPAIRSLKEEWIANYRNGILRQVKEGAKATEEQLSFVEAVYTAVTQGTEGAILSLEAWMSAYVGHDRSLWSGDELNARSPKQMAELFYGKMGLPIIVRNMPSAKGKKTKREQFDMEGAPSTNENAIRTWLSTMPKDDWRYTVLEAALTLRAINTRFSLYYTPYPLWDSPVDHRIHPQIRNCGTITKRPSGTSPNILQVSKTKDEGHTRSVFLPQSADKPDAEPEVVVSIDFVQQELYILAGESGDENLRACYTGPKEMRKDVHTSTGYTIFRQRRPEVAASYSEFSEWAGDKKAHYNTDTKDQTRQPMVIRKVYAKRTNFLAVYGGGPSGLARKLIVPKEMATMFLESFFASYPRVEDYQQRCAKQARDHGYVTTCFGNRRHLYMISDKNKAIAASAERQAGNYPIQGGAADVLKKVLREYVLRGVEEATGCTLYAPIYDELVLSCPVSKVYQLVEMLADIMEMDLPGLNIRLDTSVSIGRNWGEQIEIGSRPTEKDVNDCLAKIFAEEKTEETV